VFDASGVEQGAVGFSEKKAAVSNGAREVLVYRCGPTTSSQNIQQTKTPKPANSARLIAARIAPRRGLFLAW